MVGQDAETPTILQLKPVVMQTITRMRVFHSLPTRTKAFLHIVTTTLLAIGEYHSPPPNPPRLPDPRKNIAITTPPTAS